MTPRCILTPLASPDALRDAVTEADRAAAAAFAPRRRAEYLTWRAVVYRELGDVRIGYDAAGAPQLLGDPRRIGVSHGGGWSPSCSPTVPAPWTSNPRPAISPAPQRVF